MYGEFRGQVASATFAEVYEVLPRGYIVHKKWLLKGKGDDNGGINRAKIVVAKNLSRLQ